MGGGGEARGLWGRIGGGEGGGGGKGEDGWAGEDGGG